MPPLRIQIPQVHYIRYSDNLWRWMFQPLLRETAEDMRCTMRERTEGDSLTPTLFAETPDWVKALRVYVSRNADYNRNHLIFAFDEEWVKNFKSSRLYSEAFQLI